MDEAIGQLTTLAFFFALRSCEYTKVKITGRTQRQCLQDIQFFADKRLLNQNDPNFYSRATTVSITFRNHKNGQKMTTVTQYKNGKDLCPVLAASKIVQRVWSYKKTRSNSPINTVLIGTTLREIKGSEVLAKVRGVVTVFGKDDLGFSAADVGTHSIRSSTAMQLFLNSVPTFQIMLLRRWSSDAFLKYIRRQAQEFSEGLSKSMLDKEFFTIPEVEQINVNDPRTRNTPSFSMSRASCTNPRGAQFPSPAVHTWL